MKSGNVANSASAMGVLATIAEVHATFFVTGPTNSIEAQTALLESVASEEQTAPTHGGVNERNRSLFSARALANEAGTKMLDPILWRLTPPKYWGVVDAVPLPIARILLHYEDIDYEHIVPVCHALARLADKLHPAYAALRFKWRQSTDEQAAAMRGFSAKSLQYCKFGPPGVFVWTWFGPNLVELFGKALLRETGAMPTTWGGASLPLVEQPWTATFEELRVRQIAIDKMLRTKEIFGDYSKPVPKKGTLWTPLLQMPPNASGSAR